MQKFGLGGNPVTPTIDLHVPVAVLTGAGLPLDGNNAAYVTVVTGADGATPGHVATYLDGNLGGAALSSALSAGSPVAAVVRNFDGAAFVYVAVSGGSPRVLRYSVDNPSAPPTKLDLPPGTTPIALVLAAPNATVDPVDKEEGDGTCNSDCMSSSAFLHVLVRQN